MAKQYEFKDKQKFDCVLKVASFDKELVFLGLQSHAMHLTRDQIAELALKLNSYLKKGYWD